MIDKPVIKIRKRRPDEVPCAVVAKLKDDTFRTYETEAAYLSDKDAGLIERGYRSRIEGRTITLALARQWDSEFGRRK